jgi:cation:H+ antiporter
MPFYIISGLIGLAFIVVSCELFKNSVEWAGIRFRLNRGVTGKILAAARTAFPATIVPIIAVIFIAGVKGQEISTGAVLGPPLMLSTLAFGITGAAAFLYRALDSGPADPITDEKPLSGGLIYFAAVFAAAILFSFFPMPVKKSLGFLFLAAYVFYAFGVPANKVKDKDEDKGLLSLYFSRKKNPEGKLVLLQAAVSVIGMAVGAKFFTSGIGAVAGAVNQPAFMLALLIAPLATELPGVLSNLIWVKRKKETHALVNLSRYMVFQGTVVVFAGISVTDWILGPQARLAAVTTLVSALAMAFVLKIRKKISVYLPILWAFFYVLYLVIAFKWVK